MKWARKHSMDFGGKGVFDEPGNILTWSLFVDEVTTLAQQRFRDPPYSPSFLLLYGLFAVDVL